MNTRSSLINELRDSDYRAEYVASQINIGFPFQVRALRKARGWTQAELAKAARMAQPRIAEIENPGERKLNVETMLRLAAAFDVALEVRFVPFGSFIDWNEAFNPNHYDIPTFDQELAQAESEQQARANFESAMTVVTKPLLPHKGKDWSVYVSHPQAPQTEPRQPNLLKPDLAIVGGYELRDFNERQQAIVAGSVHSQWSEQLAG